MYNVKRPSVKEINRKLREAREAVSGDQIHLINYDSISCNALNLGYLIEDELKEILMELLL